MTTQYTIRKPPIDKSYQVLFVSLIYFVFIALPYLPLVTDKTFSTYEIIILNPIAIFVLSPISALMLILYLAYIIKNSENIFYLTTLTDPLIALNLGLMFFLPLCTLLTHALGKVILYYLPVCYLVAFIVVVPICFIYGLIHDIHYCFCRPPKEKLTYPKIQPAMRQILNFNEVR